MRVRNIQEKPAEEAAASGGGMEPWSAPQCPYSIEYSPELMAGIRQKAVAAMHMLPHGGLEIGGLLFGRVHPNARTPERLELAAERPIECAHADGPSFILSPDEHARIESQMEQVRRDPATAGLSVLGFWVSHSRADLDLSDADRELFALFPHAWQCVLVLKPKAAGVTRANFAFRSAGHPRMADPQSEFSADLAGASLPRSVQAAESADSSSTVKRRRAVSLPIAIALFALALIAGATAGRLFDKFVATALPKVYSSELDLEYFPAGAGLAVHWNKNARELQGAAEADLVLVDTSQTHTFRLTKDELRRGFHFCDNLRSARMGALRVFPAEASENSP